MRNLKKILALVLALVMSLSLMATASAASFPDVADDNAYKTAIDVLNGVKVFQGYNDGAEFRPTGEITRAEVAAIIYRISTGDVTDSQKDIYTAWNGAGKLSDVTTGWYAGYVNFCSNAGYIKGYPDGTFKASNKVTGYEVLAMILRAVGYGRNGEFSGSSWAITVGSLAETLGITKNVREPLGSPATRQMVAELLFRAIFTETQKYNSLYMYEGTGTNLAANLGLEEITGVVTANEIADLDDTTPLDAGKTRLEADNGKIYTLNVASTATDIGETRHAYVKDGTEVLTTLADTGTNKINDNPGQGTTLSKVIKDMGVRLTDETEYYINFGDSEQYTCERRLEYNVTFKKGVDVGSKTAQEWFEAEYGVKVGNVIDNENDMDEVKDTATEISYTRVIPAEKNITEDDLAIMRGIFSVADDDEADVSLGITGYVFAGTNSKNNVDRNKDLSEDLSWRTFYNDYINTAAYNIDGSDNGEWFKVIDNNSDGKADYVLLTRFVMTTITDYNSRTGYYTTEWTSEADEDASDRNTKFLDIHKDDIVSDGELSIDDVILYAKIDGKYYVDAPETVNTSIKKFIYKNDTITCADDQDRVWSGINREAAAFFEEITDTEMETGRAYTMFLDHFGYVRLVTDTSKGFVLLLDGYYETDRRGSTMKATVYNDNTGEIEDVTVAKDDGESAYYFQNEKNTVKFGYIDTWEDDHNGNRGTWKRLSTFGEYRYGNNPAADYFGHYTDYKYEYSTGNFTVQDKFRTNVAMSSVEDGEYYLSDIKDNNSRKTEYNSYELTDVSKAKARNLTGIVDWSSATAIGNTIRINTTSATRYYWVSSDKDGKTVVETWVGYSNAPEDFSAVNGYAITSTVTSVDEQAANYEIAQVVVFEGAISEDVPKAMIPYAYAANKRYQGMGWDGEGYSDESKVQSNTANASNLLNSAFDMDGNKIEENFGDYGIWAGYVVTSRDTNPDYYQFSRSDSLIEAHDGYAAGEDPAADYTSGDLDKAYRVIDKKTGSLGGYTTDTADLKLGERVIYFVDGDANVELVINVTESETTEIYTELMKLWNAIVIDYQNYQVVTVKQMFAGEEIGRVVADVNSKGIASFDFSNDFNLSGYTWGGTVSDIKGDAKYTKEIVNTNTLRISGLSGGEVFTIDYAKAVGALEVGNNGPIVLKNEQSPDGKKEVYTNFALSKPARGLAVEVLEPGDRAIVSFDKLSVWAMGTITVNGEAVNPVKVDRAEGVPAGYEKFQFEITMPKDDEPALVIVFGATGVLKDEPITPNPDDVKPDSQGNVELELDADQVKNAISTSENNTVIIEIPQTEDEKVKSTTVTLTPDVVTAVTEAEASLTVQAPQGTVTLPASAITRAVSETENAKVEVVVAEADLENVENAPEGAVAVDVTVKVNGGEAELSDLTDEITITLPYTGAEEKVDVYFVNAENTLEEVATGVAVKNGTVTFTVNHLTVFAVTQAVPAEDKELAEAKEYAKASLAGYVEWAKKNVSLESEWFNNEGELKDSSNTKGWENANYAAKENTTWCDELSNPALICELNLEAGIAEIEEMIDVAETVDDVKKIIWANKQDEAGNPIGGFDDLSWDSTATNSDFCKKFGYTGSLKAYIDQQVQLMLVEAAILEKNPNTDFSTAELDTLPTENVTDENRATHYLAAAIRGLYACVEVTPAE